MDTMFESEQKKALANIEAYIWLFVKLMIKDFNGWWVIDFHYYEYRLLFFSKDAIS